MVVKFHKTKLKNYEKGPSAIKRNLFLNRTATVVFEF